MNRLLVTALFLMVAPPAWGNELVEPAFRLSAADTRFEFRANDEFISRGESRLSDSLPQTDGRLDRLLSQRRLELVRLMSTESTRMFVGIDRSGRFGLHLEASQLLKN